jgi:hypothetical protein
MNVATYLPLLRRLRMLGAIPPASYMSSCCGQGQVYLYIFVPASEMGIFTSSPMYCAMICSYAISVITIVSFLHRQRASGCLHF